MKTEAVQYQWNSVSLYLESYQLLWTKCSAGYHFPCIELSSLAFSHLHFYKVRFYLSKKAAIATCPFDIGIVTIQYNVMGPPGHSFLLPSWKNANIKVSGTVQEVSEYRIYLKTIWKSNNFSLVLSFTAYWDIFLFNLPGIIILEKPSFLVMDTPWVNLDVYSLLICSMSPWSNWRETAKPEIEEKNNEK